MRCCNGWLQTAKTIIVESLDRFARDLAVKLVGHDMLKGLGIAIIPASALDFSIWCAKFWGPSLNLRRPAVLRS
jgi:hypothetical protein